MPSDLLYIALLFLLLVVPKFLQRYRLPSAITALVFGIIGCQIGLFAGDPTLVLLSTLGIVTLFLLAGLEVNGHELRKGARVLLQHLGIQAVVLVGATWLAHVLFRLPVRPALILGLALFTPSTGFILDSIDQFGLTPDEAFWTRSKAIGTEMAALTVMFFTLQSVTAVQLTVSTLALVGLIVAIPVALALIAKYLVPYAPKSEFAFLVMVAVLCSFATKKLGVYYLVGAFLVGAAAQLFRERLPQLSSERMMHAIEAFASVFVPFYFFNAGTEIRLADLWGWSLLTGLGFIVVIMPLRAGLILLHRYVILKEPPLQALRLAISLQPTLVFTLVLAEILHKRFAVAPHLFGGLILYTIADTLVPGFLLKHARLRLDSAPPQPAPKEGVG